MKEEHSEVMR